MPEVCVKGAGLNFTRAAVDDHHDVYAHILAMHAEDAVLTLYGGITLSMQVQAQASSPQ